MTKCRKYIAKGSPRNRELIAVDDVKDKKRFLTYDSKGRAEAGFKRNGFYTHNANDFPYDVYRSAERIKVLEAVECNMTLTTL